MSAGEFGLIERWLAPLCRRREGVALGIGDDCALLQPPAGEALALSLDTFVEGVHFLPGMAPDQLARRCFQAALSDLAAMGAEPCWLTLALTLPEADPAWLAPFSAALGEELEQAGMVLVGGDTTRGPRSLSLQVHGTVPEGLALRRDTARPGDEIWVSGTLGDAMAGLDLIRRGGAVDPRLRERFERPRARVALGLALRGIASAAIDISDGLAADLGHILSRSGVGGEIEPEAIPCSDAMRNHYTEAEALDFALFGGEDFELCFCVPPERADALAPISRELGLPLSRIGRVIAESGLWQVRRDGRRQPLEPRGYQHF